MTEEIFIGLYVGYSLAFLIILFWLVKTGFFDRKELIGWELKDKSTKGDGE